MQILCHYTSNDTAKIIIENDIIRFGKVSESNDPIEIKETIFDYSGNDQDTREMIEKDMKNYLNNILKIFCFAEGEFPFENQDFFDEYPTLHYIDNRPPFYLPRTWALYGRNSTGVCLIFEKKLTLDNIRHQLKEKYHYVQKKIEYTDFLADDTLYNMSESHFFNEDELKELKPKKIIQKYLKENVEYNYFRKDIDWRDEREYRIVCWNKIDNEDFGNTDILIKGLLKAIVLGINNNDNQIIKIAKEKNIPVFKIVYDDFILLDEK